jgi:hypothetical protein
MPPHRIAFGSCNDQDSKNAFWPIIESRKPTAFVWGGDAIYAGTEEDYRDWRFHVYHHNSTETLQITKPT